MKLKDKISLIIEDMNFMKKVELEEMKQMITKSRKEIDDLKTKLSEIEKKIKKKNKYLVNYCILGYIF